MKNLIGMVLVAAVTAWAQEKPAEPAKPKDAPVHKFVEVKHLKPADERRQAVKQLIFRLTGADVVDDQSLNVLAVKGSASQVAEAEALLKRFDVPGVAVPTHVDRQIQLTLFIVEGTPDGGTEPIPPGLKSVVDQLKGTFPFKSYRLVDTLLFQGKEGATISQEGLLPGFSEITPPPYSVSFERPTYSEDTKTFSVSRFNLNVRVPVPNGTDPNGKVTNWNFVNSQIRTDLTLREGQKLVLGKLSKDKADRAMFVVVTAAVQ